jgi:hypothetical protein
VNPTGISPIPKGIDMFPLAMPIDISYARTSAQMMKDINLAVDMAKSVDFVTMVEAMKRVSTSLGNITMANVASKLGFDEKRLREDRNQAARVVHSRG